MAASTLTVGAQSYEIFRLDEGAKRLPYTLRVLLEHPLQDAHDAPADAVLGAAARGEEAAGEAVLGWSAADEPSQEISYRPARVLHQDFTGVPAIVDLAAMRNAMQDLGGDPSRINPQLPSELVIDHSVQVDE